MLTLHYVSKKSLKSSIGQRLRCSETSLFGAEYTDNGTVTGCNHPKRSWYARITLKDGLIKAVE